METHPLAVLVVEDEPAHAEAIRRALAGPDHQVRVVDSLHACRQEIARQTPDIVIADLNLQDGKALDLLNAPPEEQAFPILVMTSHGDERTAVQAMKSGAADYVAKSPEAFADMPRIVARAMREWRLVEQRILAEDALHDALQFNQDVISCAGEGIVVLDCDLRILVWNRFMESAVGTPAAAVRGRAVLDAFPELRALGIGEILSRALEGETVTSGDIPFRNRARGESGWFVATCAPYRTADGRTAGVIATLRDVTEQRRAAEERLEMERRLLHAQRLESLGVLAGGIAHDFNNLLTSVLGHAGLALRCLDPSSRAYRFVEQIEKAALRAAELTNQMLAYSGRGAFHVVPLDLAALVREMGDLLRTVVPRHIGLRLDCPDGLPTLRGDAAQIRQVVMNLITNAAEALGAAHGDVALRIYSADTSGGIPGIAYPGEAAPPGTCVVLEVSDPGCGMDAETRARLFEPFFTTKFAGRGLGMAAVLGIVRGHQGAIRVESKPGQGTTIRVYFPAFRTDATSAEEPCTLPGAPDAAETQTILVVDDEEGVRVVARTALEYSGFAVLVAEDGQEGIECYRANADRIAAVLLDLTMPRMGGEAVFAELRTISPDVPVIVSSGYSEADARSRLGAGANVAFIQKPYRTKALIETVQRVLRDAGRPDPASPTGRND